MTIREKLLEMMKDPNSIQLALDLAKHQDAELYKVAKTMRKYCEEDCKLISILRGEWDFSPWYEMGTKGYEFAKALDVKQCSKVLNIELSLICYHDGARIAINPLK